MDRPRMLHKLLVHVVLIVGSLLMIGPFIWMLLSSGKTFAETVVVPPVIIPAQFQWNNYLEVFERLPFLQYYLNTIFTTVSKTTLIVLISSMAAYAFSRIEFPGRKLLFLLVLGMMMIPSQVFLIPKYLIMVKFGWLDSLTAIIVPGLASAFGTFLLRQFFLSLPKEVEEAAKIDGCNHVYIYTRILMPLAKPGLLALAFFQILFAWNELLWPLVVLRSPEKRLLAAGLASLQEQTDFATDFSLVMAGSVLAILPMVVLFILFQRQFIEGITLTGPKGK